MILFPTGNFSGRAIPTAEDWAKLERVAEIAYRLIQLHDPVQRLLARSRPQVDAQLQQPEFFAARITGSPAPEEVIADQQWRYPLELASGTWGWEESTQIVELRPDPDAEEVIWATNPIEAQTVESFEDYDNDCPEPDEGFESVTGSIKRAPLPPGTPVWCRWVVTTEGPKAIILGVLGATHVCGYCEEEEEE